MRKSEVLIWMLGVAYILKPASGLASVPVRSSPPMEVHPQVEGEPPSEICLGATLCAVKERIRGRTSPWTAPYCQHIANNVLSAAARENLSPALLLAVMINESNLDTFATRATIKDNTLYAKDGGLMGIRCRLDGGDRCTNGPLRGMRWSEVVKPETNIALGARALAYWRDVGGVFKSDARVRRTRHCRHKDHAYWAHYNHGNRYLSRGRARHYPHRIGVLYYALARAMSLDTRMLASMRLSVSDAGRRQRTADRPIEHRHVSLCRSISSIGPVCDEVFTVQSSKPSRSIGKIGTPVEDQGG